MLGYGKLSRFRLLVCLEAVNSRHLATCVAKHGDIKQKLVESGGFVSEVRGTMRLGCGNNTLVAPAPCRPLQLVYYLAAGDSPIMCGSRPRGLRPIYCSRGSFPRRRMSRRSYLLPHFRCFT
jgi:hypothetical protein